MNLVATQFWKDVRQFRVLLAVWFGLLLLDLAVNLGWVGQVAYSPRYGFERAANTWTTLLPIVIWGLAVLLPSLVVLTDSPARREGFLATRPLPKLDLFTAKLLFILALIVAPWTLSELVHLGAAGVPAWVVARGTLERLMFTLPVTVGGSAFAALWRGYGRWAVAVAVTTVGGYLLLAIVMLVSVNVYGLTSVSDPNLAQGMAALYELALALILFAVWHARAHRGILVRWAGLFLVATSSGLMLLLWPWNFFALRPENQPAASSLMAATGMEIPLRAVSLQNVQDTGNDKPPYFNISLTPKIQPLPANNFIQWSGLEAKLASVGGGEIRGRADHGNIFSGHWWNYYYGLPDFVAWSYEFPPDVLFRQNMNYGPARPGTLDFNHFNLPASRAKWIGPLTLQVRFEAQVFQWRRIADLPLTPGATATDEFGAWKFVATRTNQPCAQLYLERRQIELATATDSRCSSAESGVLSRMAFMVYDPLDHSAWLPDQSLFNNVTRSTHTALAQYFTELDFNNRKSFSPKEIASCRLVVFEKSWIGAVPETWQSSAFTLDEKLKPAMAGIGQNNDPMPRTEFNRRLAALKTPAADAPDREVGLYLLDFLRLVDARTFALSLSDPQTRQLAVFVPGHLDLILAGLPVMSRAAKESILNAIKLGATDAQEPAITAALQREPELAGVLLARGWVGDARLEVLRLAGSPRPLPLDAMRAIAWFHEPETYPRLLEEFEAAPTVAADDLLRSLPGLEPQLDAIVARQWHAQSLVFHRNSEWQMFGGIFHLALRHGQTSAIGRAYVFLDDPEFDEMNTGYLLAPALADEIPMPDLLPQDLQKPEIVLAWMRKHRPEDFVFNPSLRQFVLQPGANPGQTASNP